MLSGLKPFKTINVKLKTIKIVKKCARILPKMAKKEI